MFQKKKGIDIVVHIGGITTFEAAMRLFENRLDEKNLSRIQQIKNPEVAVKIANSIAMCEPETVFINTGSESDKAYIRELALKNGEEANLPMDGHTIHFDLKDEQGRIIDRTYYISNEGEDISSLANKMDRAKALIDIRDKMTGIMSGKTMIVGFYMRGPIGSPASNPALEITSSAYVSHSAEILYRNAFSDFKKEVDRLGHFYTNIHSEGRNRPEDLPNARVFMDRSHQTTYSFNCTYAGNTLLLKKGNHRFSVDKAVYENRGNELSEHMFITGIEAPGGRITWCTGAAPSGCGKTTTAMAGHHFVGDDLAQMWIDENGCIRSINPECGIFGIVEDVNREGDPYLMKLLREPGTEVIWSNVLIDENGVPHWTGNGEDPPLRGKNFQGDWEKGMTDEHGKEIPISHPNSRCTLTSSALANYSSMSEEPNGVETRVVTYSGRDSDTMPPVWAAQNPDEGVVIGACIVSAATATEVGATGVKRAPWANAPFIPGSLAEYMNAQFKFFGNEKIAQDKKPIMAGLNYFLTDKARGGTSSKLIGEKRDVKVWLAWLERLAHNEVDVIKTPVGNLPTFDDLKNLFKTIIDKEYTEELYVKQFSLYIDNIVSRIDMQLEAYGKEPDIPEKLFEILKAQKEGLAALRNTYGSVVTPSQLEE
ncbi:MAG: phosphoenolpyruvate carboxykinase (GTP) [Desulfobacterales bacterium]|nr:phosphoenolpyruvate carboxykinase (GTP) [Desulfobacterales bacterium]